MADTAVQPAEVIAKRGLWAKLGKAALHTILVTSGVAQYLFVTFMLLLCFALDVELGSFGAWTVIIVCLILIALHIGMAQALGLMVDGKPIGTYAGIFSMLPFAVGWHAIVTCIVILVRG